ncbi:MAG: hypothetical protein HY316_06490 [Acidobacteria bacterium]|nr:hypothetical protein [Acidobacteriota bacterium]
MSIVAVPRGAILDTWFNDPWKNGVQIDRLADMQRVHVRTRYSLYEITIIDAREGEILVRGGKFFPELTEAHLQGATLGGSFCKLRGIYCGFKMEILGNGQRIITSNVQTISVFAGRLDDTFASR